MRFSGLLSPGSQLARHIPWPRLGAAGWLLLAGLALRLAHYLCNHSIWYDEAVLLFNILGKGYARLLGALDYEVAAPPLFLWGLRTIAVVVGDHPYVWRLPPFLISCLTLALMADLTRRMLRPFPAAVVIGLVAFSDAFVWLGCNVKPYILDAFLATGFLHAYVRTEGWTPSRRILLFGLAAPVLLSLSYPMVFLYAGLFPAFGPLLWRQRRAGPWAAYVGLAAIVGATLVGLYLGPIRAQKVSGLVAGWMNKFPHADSPGGVPGWVIGNTFLVFHYCYNPIGAGCVVPVAAGAWWCLRKGRFDWLCLCLGPVAACLVAAFLHVYPYSNNRLILFAAPGIGLLTGLGLSALLERSRRPGLARAAMVGILLLPEMGLCLIHLARPWAYPDAASSARFVKEQQRPGDVVASMGGTYTYFFFGRLCSLLEVDSAGCSAGQRVWVVMDCYAIGSAEERRERVRAQLPAPDWELRSEKLFEKASVFLLVRRGPREVSLRQEEKQ